MDKELLVELKELTTALSEDLKLRKEELQFQIEKEKQQQELASVSGMETEAKETAIQLEKEKAEKRAVQLEQFIENLESRNESEISFNEQLLKSVSILDTREELKMLGDKLDVLIQTTEVPEETQEINDFSHFTDLSLVTWLFAFIPAYLAYKGLTSFFDNAFA